EKNCLVRRAVSVRSSDGAMIGMRGAWGLVPLADLREITSAIGTAIDVQAGDEEVIGIGRINPDHIAVPPLIAEVSGSGIGQRVGLAAISALVDFASVAIDSCVNRVRIALRVSDGDQTVRRDAARQIPGGSAIGAVNG